jgi:type IV pilus assembly protein PilM
LVLSYLLGKDSFVGIDIGSSSIKASEIEPSSDGWRLVNAAVQTTPPESVRDGVITNIFDVSQAIRNLLRSANIKSTGAIAAISGSQVIVRQCQFPQMSEAALRKSIKYEAAKYISASMDDSIVEFEIMDSVQGTDQMNVMLVAAPRDMVDSRVAVLEAAGIEPIAVDVEAFSLIRALVDADRSGQFREATAAFVDMGASHTDVNVVSKSEFALTRNIPIAGDSFTNAIKTLTGFSHDDAERLKFEMAAQESLDKLNLQEVENKCWRVVQPLLDELLREIRRSVHYYQSQFPEGSQEAVVSKIILSGGTARMPGMAAYVSGKLNVPVEIADPFSETCISPGRFAGDFVDEHGPVLTIAAGLALKEELSKSKLAAA